MSWRTFVINTLKPSNHELRSVIEAALWKNFKNVQVEVEKCPDLTAAPFHMTSPGFGRNLVIAEVGGWGNLFPNLHKEKLYDIKLDHYTSPYKTLFVNSTKFVLMGNLAITPEPGPAEVVHIKCSQRTGKDSFPGCIRKHMAQHYGQWYEPSRNYEMLPSRAFSRIIYENPLVNPQKS
ncbi:hypothetical protein ANCCEY_08542 [Ancylostoma ceylanicum]|uniref:DUF1907 domain-containing protein n=1 Tax=Ancylostoma ceylanicum TaxID=53326 RepID=A0A0D6LKB6_9BILA|nr:hypothetical protein ANCCEY_08542 [Ancylostoma ceylanicum]